MSTPTPCLAQHPSETYHLRSIANIYGATRDPEQNDNHPVYCSKGLDENGRHLDGKSRHTGLGEHLYQLSWE